MFGVSLIDACGTGFFAGMALFLGIQAMESLRDRLFPRKLPPRQFKVQILDSKDGWPVRTYSIPEEEAIRLMAEIERTKA